MQRPRRALLVGLAVVVAATLALVVGPQIARAVKDLLERISELPGPALAATVGVLALLETAAFAGLAVPGELAVVIGGVAAYQGKVPVQVMAAAAVVGAIGGDSLGFWLGRRLGTRFLDGRLGRLMGRERVLSTMNRIRVGGIKAVVLGRFVGVLRAIMPFAAGASGMSYRRFAVASVLGATSWGVGFTLAGYFAGNSWRQVEAYAGQASKLLAIVIGVVVVLVVVARKAAERQDRLRAVWQAFLDRPRISAVRRRYQRQIGFLVRRFRPGPAAGLQLTASLIGLAVLGYALAVVVGQVLGSGGLVDTDDVVRRELASARTDEGVDVMRVVRNVLSPAGAWVAALVVGGACWVADRRPRALVLLVGAVGGAALLAEGVQQLIARSRVLDSLDALVVTQFPSRHLTMVTAAAYALLATLLPRLRRWTWVVALVAFVTGLVALSGVAVLYLAQVYFSDAVGGVTLGAVWGLAVATAVATMWRRPRSRRDVDRSEVDSS